MNSFFFFFLTKRSHSFIKIHYVIGKTPTRVQQTIWGGVANSFSARWLINVLPCKDSEGFVTKMSLFNVTAKKCSAAVKNKVAGPALPGPGKDGHPGLGHKPELRMFTFWWLIYV